MVEFDSLLLIMHPYFSDEDIQHVADAVMSLFCVQNQYIIAQIPLKSISFFQFSGKMLAKKKTFR